MRPTQIRLTIRLLMAIVAISALVVAGFVWLPQRKDFQQAALYHAGRAEEERQQERNCAKYRMSGGGSEPLIPLIERLSGLRLAYHTEMRRKYEWAADHLWESVTADPPEPTDERLITAYLEPFGPLKPIDHFDLKLIEIKEEIPGKPDSTAQGKEQLTTGQSLKKD
jgi:hypothetical protein